ncbi:unnamed protein product [Amoebophrya sp. A120]|nr:unnamed protein product [Amoebophrya sp. A120]|eukprot:GSA120T00017348001.1
MEGGLCFAVDTDPCGRISTKVERKTSKPSSASVTTSDVAANPNVPAESHARVRDEKGRPGEVASSTSTTPERYPFLERLQVVKSQLLETRARQDRYFATSCPELGRPCFVCGQIGHTKKDCPKRHRNNASESKAGGQNKMKLCSEENKTAAGCTKVEPARVLTEDLLPEKKRRRKSNSGAVVPTAAKARLSNRAEGRYPALLQDDGSMPIELPASLGKMWAALRAAGSTRGQQNEPGLEQTDEGNAASKKSSKKRKKHHREDALYRELELTRDEKKQLLTIPVELAGGDTKINAAPSILESQATAPQDRFSLELWSAAERTELLCSAPSDHPDSMAVDPLERRCLVCGDLGHGLGLEKCPRVAEERRRKYEETQAYYRAIREREAANSTSWDQESWDNWYWDDAAGVWKEKSNNKGNNAARNEKSRQEERPQSVWEGCSGERAFGSGSRRSSKKRAGSPHADQADFATHRHRNSSSSIGNQEKKASSPAKSGKKKKSSKKQKAA